MKVLITGGAGFIGSHVAENLCKDKRVTKITIIDNLSSGKKKNLDSIIKSKKIKFLKLDIFDLNKIKRFFKNISIVFHLAGNVDVLPSVSNPRKYMNNNLLGTLNVLESMKNYKVKKIIYASSSSCYGDQGKISIKETNPINIKSPYAFSKYSAEQLIILLSEIYNFSYISLRLFNVYGPRSKMSGNYSSVISIFLKQKKNKKLLTIVGKGNQSRDFIYVKDVAEAFKKAAFLNIKNQVFNLGTGKSITINQLAKIIGGKKRNIPKRSGDIKYSKANNKKIIRKLKWKPKKNFFKNINMMIENN